MCYALGSPKLRNTPAAGAAGRAERVPISASPWRQRHTVPSNFDLEAPAAVYLMNHFELNALKVGVTTVGRIEEHEAHGWTLLCSWGFVQGYDALEVEERVLDRWRNVFSMPIALPPAEMPQGGFTETTMDTPSARSDTIEFINSIHRDRSAEIDDWAEQDLGDEEPWDDAW